MTTENAPSDAQCAQINHPVSTAISNTFEPLTFTVAETAAILGVSPATVYRLITRRILRPVPGLRHKLIHRQQVYELAQGGKRHA